MKTVEINWKRLLALFCTAFLLLSFPTLALAETKAKASAQKSTKSTKSKTAKAKAPTKKDSPAPAVIDEAAVHSSFETFTQDWMKKLAETEEYQRTELIKISQTGETFSAEYVGYLPQRFIEVKKTTSQETPFIGTLTYYQRTLRCTGKTKEAATQGPFEQVETIPVKEIFRFTKGKWVY